MEEINVKIIEVFIVILLYTLFTLQNWADLKSRSMKIWGVISYISAASFLIFLVVYPERTLWVVVTALVASVSNANFWLLRTTEGEKRRDIVIASIIFMATIYFATIKH